MNEFEKNCARLIRCKFFFLESVEKKHRPSMERPNECGGFLLFTCLCTTEFIHILYTSFQLLCKSGNKICTTNYHEFHSICLHLKPFMSRTPLAWHGKKARSIQNVNRQMKDRHEPLKKKDRTARTAHAQPKRFEVVNVFKVN